MGLLNARAMLESSFGKTEKVLDADKIKQLNSGCSDGCTEDFGDRQSGRRDRQSGNLDRQSGSRDRQSGNQGGTWRSSHDLDLAREASGEVWETHGVQDQLEDDEAGKHVEMMEGVEESQDQDAKLNILKQHPGRKRKRSKKTSKHEEVNKAIKERNKHYDSEGIYLPLFWPNPNVCPSFQRGGPGLHNLNLCLQEKFGQNVPAFV